MAKTAASIRAAKAKAREFREAAQEAELRRNRISAARIELTRLKEIEQNKAAAAQRKAEETAMLLQAARKAQAAQEKEAARVKAESEAAMEVARKQAAEKQRQMQERMKREQAAFVKAKARREKAAADALAQAKAQYEAEMQARRDKDAAQVAAHKKMLADKKAAFEASFRNVWGTSVSGMSMFTVDIEPQEAGGADWTSIEETIVQLFKKTLISDVRDFVDIKRWYKNDINYGSTNVNAQMKNQMKRRLTGLTTDDRVAELIEESIDIQQREDLDILIW